MRERTVRVLAVAGLTLWAAAAGGAERVEEARSLLGEALFRPELPDGFRELQTGLLEAAEARLAASPRDPANWVWVGRRTAYLGRYREAVAIYTRALRRFPASAELLRHRGHRYITLRRFDDAVTDLERAAALRAGREDQVEADGLPNERGIPTSTLHTNIWYHLGLARWLRGDAAGAATAFRRCLELSANPDMFSAAAHWLWVTLRRTGAAEEGAALLSRVGDGWELLESHDYYRLLGMYRGHESPATVWEAVQVASPVAAATLGYGLGAWHLAEGEAARAVEIFESVVAAGSWAAFGHIAAEAELARLANGPPG